MEIMTDSLSQQTESQLGESEAPADRYWRNVLKGQRLFAQAEEQQRMNKARREVLRDRRGALRASLDQIQAGAESCRSELEGQKKQPVPLTPEEQIRLDKAMAILYRALKRVVARKIAEQNAQSESIAPDAEGDDGE